MLNPAVPDRRHPRSRRATPRPPTRIQPLPPGRPGHRDRPPDGRVARHTQQRKMKAMHRSLRHSHAAGSTAPVDPPIVGAPRRRHRPGRGRLRRTIRTLTREPLRTRPAQRSRPPLAKTPPQPPRKATTRSAGTRPRCSPRARNPTPVSRSSSARDDGTMVAWMSTAITQEEFDAIELPAGWSKNQPRGGGGPRQRPLLWVTGLHRRRDGAGRALRPRMGPRRNRSPRSECPWTTKACCSAT